MINGQDFRSNCINANQTNFEDARLLTVASTDPGYVEVDPNGEYSVYGPVVANFQKDGARRFLIAEPSQVLVIGGTGAGKTSCYFQTQLEAYARSANKPSVFVMDVKGDMYREKSELLRKNGYEVFVLNFRQPFESARYNPLGSIFRVYREATAIERKLSCATGEEREYDGVTYATFEEWVGVCEQEYYKRMDYCQNELLNIAKIICPIESKKDPSWDMGSKNIIFGILWGLLEDSAIEGSDMTEQKYTLFNLVNTAYRTEGDCENIIRWARSHERTSPAYNLVSYYDLHAKQTRDSYINNTNNKLNKLANIPIRALTSASDVDVEGMARSVAERPVAIFCITDETRSVTYDLCLMFINHMLTALQGYADSIGGALKTDFHFLLDEFANMPTLPNAQKWISTLRSRRVWLHLGIQSFEQLDELYGEHGRGIIVDNCNTQIFFGCNNVKTTKEYAESLGQHCVTTTSISFSPTGEISTNFSPSVALLVRQSDLSTLCLGEAFVRCFRHPSLRTTLEPNFLCEDFAHGVATPVRVTKNLDFLEETYYDIKKTFERRDDEDSFGFSLNRHAKKFVEKLTDGEKELFKKIMETDDMDGAKAFLRDSAAEIRPYAKSLLEKGVLTAKMGKFSLPMNEEIYKRVRMLLLQGALPEDPGPFRRRNGGPF